MPKCGGCYIRDLLINHYGFKNSLPHKKKTVLQDFFVDPQHYENSDGTITTIRKHGLVRYFQTPYSESDVYDELQDSEKRVVNNIIWHMISAIQIENRIETEPPVYNTPTTNAPPPKTLTPNHKIPLPPHEEFADHDLPMIYNKIIGERLDQIQENEKDRHVHLSQEQWTEYYKFTFIRCPYAKLHSAYLYCKKSEFEDCDPKYYEDFNEFVTLRDKIGNEAWFHAFITQLDHLVDFSGNLHMNYIGHVENLDNDLLCILHQIGIKEIKHWDNIQNDRIINRSKRDRPFYECYDDASFQFVNEWFARDFQVFQMKRFKNLQDLQNYHRNKVSDLSKKPTELYKRLSLFKIYNVDKIIECVENLGKEYDNYIGNLKIINRISDDDHYFHHGKSIVNDIITDIQKDIAKIHGSKDFMGSVLSYMETTNGEFKKPKKRCKNCGFVAHNFFAHIAHANICSKIQSHCIHYTNSPGTESNPLNK